MKHLIQIALVCLTVNFAFGQTYKEKSVQLFSSRNNTALGFCQVTILQTDHTVKFDKADMEGTYKYKVKDPKTGADTKLYFAYQGHFVGSMTMSELLKTKKVVLDIDSFFMATSESSKKALELVKEMYDDIDSWKAESK